MDSTFLKRVATLALPIALQMLMQSVMGMADVYMVSGLGQTAIAAVGLSAKLHFLLIVLMGGIATACSVLIAQYYGAGNKRLCCEFLAVTLFVGGLTMLPCMALFFFNNQLWLSLISPDTGVVALASTYLMITAPALLITQFIIVYEGALRSTGNTTTPLAMGALAGSVNIGLNYVLIFGHFGFPEMGVAGAAWATLMARLLQLTALLIWIYGRKHFYAMDPRAFAQALSRPLIKRFVLFAIPLVVNYLIWGLGNSVYHIFTGFSGTHALAAMGILVPLESAFFALFVGLANASAVMIGQALGGDKIDLAWNLYKIFDRIAISLALFLCVGIWLLRPWLVDQFANVDPETTQTLYNLLAVFCLLTWIKVLNLMRIIGVLRAGGDNNFVLWVDTTAMWGLGIPLFIATIFWLKLPFIYVFIAMFIEDIAKALPMYWRIGKRRWLKNLTTT